MLKINKNKNKTKKKPRQINHKSFNKQDVCPVSGYSHKINRNLNMFSSPKHGPLPGALQIYAQFYLILLRAITKR